MYITLIQDIILTCVYS